MTFRPLFLACTIFALLVSCAPQQPVKVAALPEAPTPQKPSEEQLLFERMQALSARAEDPDLSDEQVPALSREMAEAAEAYFEAPEPVRRSPKIQGSLERMCDHALQLGLDANAAPDTPPLESESPRDMLPQATTFLPPEELQKTLDEVKKAQASVEVGIPVPVDNKAVLTYVNMYQTKFRNWFAGALERGAPYVPGFRGIFKDEGVPPDLVYLAIVESAFKSNAVSRARAAGMWQFIQGTARRYGLVIDFWEDQRFDPELSARASAHYLKDLYDMFGDWQLALAAYNAGEMKIQRSLERTQKETFWDLKTTRYLRRETREYVPAILAAILIATNPAAYGFDPPKAAAEPMATVTLEQPMDLRVLARCAGIPLDALQAANPSLRRLITPPRQFSLKLPADKLETFQAGLAQVPPEEKAEIVVHRVAAGESLRSIASKYQVSANLVRIVNRLNAGRVRVGQELVIPRGSAATDPTLYAEERASPKKHSQKIYKVRRGDTLAGICARTGVPVQTLRELNNISGDTLKPGQRLVLTSVAGAREAGGNQGSRPGSNARVHHVRQGDTLYQLALQYSTTVDKLCRLNRISPGKTLHLGDTLLIP